MLQTAIHAGSLDIIQFSCEHCPSLSLKGGKSVWEERRYIIGLYDFGFLVLQATTQVIGQSLETPTGPSSEVTIIPLWVYFVAIFGGAIILALIFFGLWKVRGTGNLRSRFRVLC